MKKQLFLLTAAILVLLSATFGPNKESIAIGSDMPLPNYPLKKADGSKTLALQSLAEGNGLLVIFSCNTCPFVLGWEDRYNEINQVAKRNKIGTVLVNSNEAKRSGDDSPEAMLAHAKEKAYNIPYLIDEKHVLADAFGAKTTPHVFLFDANKKLVYKGAIDDNFKDKNAVKKRYLQNALNSLGAGKPIEIKETPAKGCSIKRVL